MYTAIPSKFTSRHKWATLQLWTGRQTAVPHYLLAEEKKQAPGWRDGVGGGGGGGAGVVGWGGGGPFNTTLTSTWKAAWRNKSLSSSR